MKNHVITIPFSQLRSFLPADGTRLVVWNGTKNKWPKNSDPFMRHETAEIAFGRAIRAQFKHRPGEKSMAPGISCQLGHIRVRGGWAAHVAVPVHNDFFDGKFEGNLFASVVRGEVRCELRDFNFDWNASFVAKLVDFTGKIRKVIIDIIKDKVQAKLNAELKKKVDQVISVLLKRVPGAQLVKSRTSVMLMPDRVMVVVHYEQRIRVTLPGGLATRPAVVGVVKRAGTTPTKRLAVKALAPRGTARRA